jgi:hypothetical protein
MEHEPSLTETGNWVVFAIALGFLFGVFALAVFNT